MFCFTCFSPAFIAKEILCLYHQQLSHRSGLHCFSFHSKTTLYYLKRTARSYLCYHVYDGLGSMLPVSVGTSVFKKCALCFEIVIMQLRLCPLLLSEDTRPVYLLNDPELDLSTVT